MSPPKPLAHWEASWGSLHNAPVLGVSRAADQGWSRRVWEWFLKPDHSSPGSWRWDCTGGIHPTAVAVCDGATGERGQTVPRWKMQDRSTKQGKGDSPPHLPNIPPRERVWSQPSGEEISSEVSRKGQGTDMAQPAPGTSGRDRPTWHPKGAASCTVGVEHSLGCAGADQDTELLPPPSPALHASDQHPAGESGHLVGESRLGR